MLTFCPYCSNMLTVSTIVLFFNSFLTHRSIEVVQPIKIDLCALLVPMNFPSQEYRCTTEKSLIEKRSTMS